MRAEAGFHVISQRGVDIFPAFQARIGICGFIIGHLGGIPGVAPPRGVRLRMGGGPGRMRTSLSHENPNKGPFRRKLTRLRQGMQPRGRKVAS